MANTRLIKTPVRELKRGDRILIVTVEGEEMLAPVDEFACQGNRIVGLEVGGRIIPVNHNQHVRVAPHLPRLVDAALIEEFGAGTDLGDVALIDIEDTVRGVLAEYLTDDDDIDAQTDRYVTAYDGLVLRR